MGKRGVKKRPAARSPEPVREPTPPQSPAASRAETESDERGNSGSIPDARPQSQAVSGADGQSPGAGTDSGAASSSAIAASDPDQACEEESIDEAIMRRVKVLCPTPATELQYNLKGKFAENGFAQLTQFMKEGMLRLADSVRAELMEFLEMQSENIQRIATACSGSDAPLLVCRAFAEAVYEMTGTALDMEHTFSCEKDQSKQRFLKRMFTNMKVRDDEMCFLFKDTKDLRDGPGHEAEDCLLDDGEASTIPSCTELWLGFPCVDVSKLNPSAPKNAWVVKDASKRTGAVFSDMMSYVEGVLSGKRQNPLTPEKFRGMMLENVIGLGEPPLGNNPCTAEPWRSNLDHCNARVEKLGMFMVVFSLSPSMFGAPISRTRLWMICLPSSLLDDAGMEFEEAMDLALQTMNRLCSSKLRSLDDFLLDETSSCVQKELQRVAFLCISWRSMAHRTGSISTAITNLYGSLVLILGVRRGPFQSIQMVCQSV